MDTNCKNFEMIKIIQSFIHTMNDKSLRTEIINHYLKKRRNDFNWLGTWTVELNNNNNLNVIQNINQLSKSNEYSLENLINKNIDKFQEKICLFTVCIVYEINLVHFVSFIYFPNEKKLISFDPGVELYLHGQNTILPNIRKVFKKNKLISNIQIKTQQNLGTCTAFNFCGKKWGIQYNGNHNTNLPADSFCQTWTIFFLIKYIQNNNFNFVSEWCKEHPSQREFIIIKEFMIPFTQRFKNVQNTYLLYLNHNEQSDDIKNVLKKLKNYLKNCNKKLTITCPLKKLNQKKYF